LRLITNTEQSRGEERSGEKSIVSPSTESKHGTILVIIQSSQNSHIITSINTNIRRTSFQENLRQDNAILQIIYTSTIILNFNCSVHMEGHRYFRAVTCQGLEERIV
jgi:hypothetical protein